MRLNGVQRLLETGLIISTALAAFILCALISFDPADPSWSQTGEFIKVKNITGTAGAWFADIFIIYLWLARFFLCLRRFNYLAICFLKKPHKLLQLDYMTLGLRLLGMVFFCQCGISN